MMKKDVAGTLRPTKNAGGLRRVMLALVVLLLSATLMVGAVSAAETTISNPLDEMNEVLNQLSDVVKNAQELTFTNGEATISGSGNQVYTIKGVVPGNITISAPAGSTVILTTEGGIDYYKSGMNYLYNSLVMGDKTAIDPGDPTQYLVGNITISGGANVMLAGMVILANESNVYNEDYAAAVRVTASNPGELSIVSTYIDFNEIIADKTGYAVVSDHKMKKAAIGANLIGNLTGAVLNLNNGCEPMQDIAPSVEMAGNIVLMGYEKITPSTTNSALLRIAGTHDEKTIYHVNGNLVFKFNENMNDVNLVRVDSPSKQENIGIWMFDNYLANQKSMVNDWANMYRGTVEGHELGQLYVYHVEDDNSNSYILEPGLNQTDVIWREYPKADVTILRPDNYISTSTFDINLNTVKGVIINGKPVDSTDIVISGKTSVELTANPVPVELTATVHADDSYGHNIAWRISSGSDVIQLVGGSSFTVQYLPLKTGTATLTVTTTGGLTKDVVITVYDIAEPKVDTLVKVEGDKLNITTTTGGSSTIEVPASAIGTTTTAKIVTVSGVNLTLTYSDDAEIIKDNAGNVIAVKGTVQEIVADYPTAPALSSTVNDISGMEYSLKIKLDVGKVLSGGNILLPTIDPRFDQTADTAVKYKYPTANTIVMVCASGDLDTINRNIAENGVELKFTIPLSSVNKDTLEAFHIDSEGEVTIIESDKRKIEVDGTNVVITIYSSHFSDYVIGEYTATSTGDPTIPGTSGSSIQGSSTWLQSTPTENPTPTDNPTDTVPTDVPTTQPTQTETKTPGFGVLLVLAGLGAVAVLRRK